MTPAATVFFEPADLGTSFTHAISSGQILRMKF